MNNHTWNRFSCLLNAPVDSSLDAIRHWQYVHAERKRVDELICSIFEDSDQLDDFDSLTDDQEARVEELYCHLERVYKTYKQGDHSQFASPDTPQVPTFVSPPVPSHIETAFKEWRQQCWSAFKKPELIEHLPRPPCITCFRIGCDNTSGPLKTCVHTLERLYRSAELSHRELIKERNFWHPDRWSRVSQPHRQEVERMAILVFQVLQPLCDEIT